MCNAISTAHPKAWCVQQKYSHVDTYMDIHVSSPAMGARLDLLTKKITSPLPKPHTHTCVYTHARTHAHVMHSKDPKFRQSNNRMWNKPNDYIKNKHIIQNISHTALKCYIHYIQLIIWWWVTFFNIRNSSKHVTDINKNSMKTTDICNSNRRLVFQLRVTYIYEKSFWSCKGHLMFIGPCIIAIVDEWMTNLMSLANFTSLIMCSTYFGH